MTDDEMIRLIDERFVQLMGIYSDLRNEIPHRLPSQAEFMDAVRERLHQD